MQNSARGGETSFDRLNDLISAIQPRAEIGNQLSPQNKKLQFAVRHAIDSGVLGHGDRLPPENELSRAFGMPVKSVKRALDKMVGEGVLRQSATSEKFVAHRYATTLSTSNGFSSDAAVKGHATRFEMLSKEVGQPTELELDMLELSPGDLVTRIHRVRLADEKPVCVELACLPSRILPVESDISQSLYAFLAERNLRPVRGVQRVRAQVMQEREAKLLQVAPGSPCLFAEQQSFLKSGEPIEYVCTHFRGDAYDFIIEMKVGG
ncbi:GntR family transcriptional regulator [uncultured Maritalea sp.]|uniref:GntR family transcriptional regulator n=1 Tax=uncultured Maritalea sp. TaxID=757249 RepID=UPI0026386A16|nr:GntR family transcriptional regulator [uncultured Maritalea sp.]